MLYRFIYLNDYNGFVVYRHIRSAQCTIEEMARDHRIATFVTEDEARDYCHYRNEMMHQYGDDSLLHHGVKAGDSDVLVHFNFGDKWPSATTQLSGIPFHGARLIRDAYIAGISSCKITTEGVK